MDASTAVLRGVDKVGDVRNSAVPSTERLVVPDVLRGVAIVAMLIAHAAPFVPNSPWIVKFASANISDLASPLFALVMGMSAQLLWSRSPRTGRTLWQQAVRGVILIVLGVWMATWGSWVAVVLQPLGLLLIVGAPLLLLGTRWVWAALLVLLVVSQPVVAAARAGSWWFFDQGPGAFALADWTVNGTHYRLLNLLPFFLLGGLLARHGLKRDRMLWAMAIAAPLFYAPAAIVRKLGVTVDSGDYLDTFHDVGLAFATYAVIVLIATARISGRAEHVRASVFMPFRAWGQVALSLYLLHVAAIALWNNTSGRPYHNVYGGWLLIVPGMCLIAWLWWRYVGNGPVEWLMGFATGRRRPIHVVRHRA